MATPNYTTTANVQAMAKNLELSGDTIKTSMFTNIDINSFLAFADSVIDSNLSAVYFTPLQQITRGGGLKYPDPIPFIATCLAAGWMVESVYSRIDPQISDAGKVHKEKAIQELEAFVLRSRRLDGQIHRNQNSFINPQIAPLNVPEPKRF